MRASGRADRRAGSSARRGGKGSTATRPSFFADVVEDQIGGVLATFALPEERRASALVAQWAARQGARQSTAQERERLTRKAERVKTLYLEGDLDDAEYRRQRADVAEALAAIPADDLPTSEAVGAAAGGAARRPEHGLGGGDAGGAEHDRARSSSPTW